MKEVVAFKYGPNAKLRSMSSHRMKMLHESRAAHVLLGIWEVRFNGVIYFLI